MCWCSVLEAAAAASSKQQQQHQQQQAASSSKQQQAAASSSKQQQAAASSSKQQQAAASSSSIKQQQQQAAAASMPTCQACSRQQQHACNSNQTKLYPNSVSLVFDDDRKGCGVAARCMQGDARPRPRLSAKWLAVQSSHLLHSSNTSGKNACFSSCVGYAATSSDHARQAWGPEGFGNCGNLHGSSLGCVGLPGWAGGRIQFSDALSMFWRRFL